MEVDIGENLCDLGLCKDHLDRTHKVQSTIEKKIDVIYKLDFLKIKFLKLCSSRGNVEKMNRQAMDREKIFAKHISDQGQ